MYVSHTVVSGGNFTGSFVKGRCGAESFILQKMDWGEEGGASWLLVLLED